VTSGASGSGNGTVTYQIAANTASSARTGALAIAGYTISITEGTRGNVRIAPLAPRRAEE